MEHRPDQGNADVNMRANSQGSMGTEREAAETDLAEVFCPVGDDVLQAHFNRHVCRVPLVHAPFAGRIERKSHECPVLSGAAHPQRQPLHCAHIVLKNSPPRQKARFLRKHASPYPLQAATLPFKGPPKLIKKLQTILFVILESINTMISKGFLKKYMKNIDDEKG